ncbi:MULTISPECIES: hypothetical protein [Mycolicibacterium]|uniref:Uncharacterized protein n=1 Tax=Mycolicibacterium mageritense TaxID=53462 RepID=A0AAI8XL99_MYCME|nr:hypothetical protein [Mycolicibacterium mageritense]MBN3458024.1 hypothetical protein [Mycobacterium sp. DSM 3803]BDY26651.1 hypothetical protein hbim_00566 [Mycolicibacterium mageritense]
MGRHRAMSDRSRRARVLFGGVVAGASLTVAGPAGLAFAAPGVDNAAGPEPETPHKVETAADAVARPDFKNPAPGVRAIQNVGDTVFNNGSALNTAVNGSPIGDQYHRAFGTRGTITVDDEGVQYYQGDGTNGYVTGVLNTGTGGRNGQVTVPGQVYAQTVNIRECGLKVANESGLPTGVRKCRS